MTHIQQAYTLLRQNHHPLTDEESKALLVAFNVDFTKLPIQYLNEHFFYLAKKGFCWNVLHFIERGMPLSLTDASGDTVLHKAASYGHNVMLDMLFVLGGKGVAGALGMTPLHVATINDNYEAIKICLFHDSPQILHRDFNGLTPIQIAVQKDNIQLMSLFVDFKKFFIFFPDGQATPLHEALYAGSFEVAKYLIKNASELVNMKDQYCNTALHIAAYRGDIEIVELLLQAGAQINAQNNLGDTPVIEAISVGDTDVVMLLMDSGADLCITNLFGQVPESLINTSDFASIRELSGYVASMKLALEVVEQTLAGEYYSH